MIKRLFYIRTSTEEQNPETQIKDIESLLNGQEYILYTEKQSAYKDNIKERPIFKKVLELIKSNRNIELYVWDLDRLYRNRVNLVSFFELCDSFGTRVYSYRQKWLNDIKIIPPPFNDIVFKLVIQILGWIAEEESNKLGERVKKAVLRQNNTTLSYKGNKWGRKSLSGSKLKEISKLRKSGLSIRKISKQLNISIGAVHKYISNNQEGKNEVF